MLTSFAALSVSDQVEKFGAYAGFAAVVGLAVLALLYFASARELKRLREWADRAPERVADLEARVGDLARQRAVLPGPVAKGPAAKPGAKPATAAGKPVAKGKAAAAATAAAANGDAKDAAKKPAAKDAAATDAEPPAEDDAPAVFDVVEEAPGDLTEIKKPAGKAPASDETMVSPGAGRALRQNKPSARPRSQPPVRPSTARLMESARATSAQRMTGAPPPGAAPPSKPAGEGNNRKKYAFIGGGVAVVLVLLILVSGVLGGGGGTEAPKTNEVVAPTATTDTTASSSTIDRAATEVAVLNGTTFAGLAKGVADKVSQGGFKRGEVRNAIDNTRAATIVEYTPGNRPAALEVAKTIDVGTDAVAPVQAGTQALAPSAQVIVTVGADQNPTTTG